MIAGAVRSPSHSSLGCVWARLNHNQPRDGMPLAAALSSLWSLLCLPTQRTRNAGQSTPPGSSCDPRLTAAGVSTPQLPCPSGGITQELVFCTSSLSFPKGIIFQWPTVVTVPRQLCQPASLSCLMSLLPFSISSTFQLNYLHLNP